MRFEPFNTLEYKTITEKKIGSLEDVKTIIFSEISKSLTRTGEASHTILMGTDSQQKGRYTYFVTIIILNKMGQGSRGFFARYKVPRIESINERLFSESMRTIELALELNDIFDRFAIIPEIHADVNPDLRHKSSAVYRQVIGYIEAQGYTYIVKPDSWCATNVADHLVKAKTKRKRTIQTKRSYHG